MVEDKVCDDGFDGDVDNSDGIDRSVKLVSVMMSVMVSTGVLNWYR